MTPLIVVPHAAGALWGTVAPVETFEVTQNVPPSRIADVDPDLAPGALETHSGTGALIDGPDDVPILGSVVDSVPDIRS